MWVAVTLVAITGIGAAFLVWFLVGLLREGAPAVSYWVLPVRDRPEIERHPVFLGCIYADEDCRAPAVRGSDYYVELLENEVHAKECASSGLIGLDVRPISASVGWRSSQLKRFHHFPERRV